MDLKLGLLKTGWPDVGGLLFLKKLTSTVFDSGGWVVSCGWFLWIWLVSGFTCYLHC